MNSVKTTVATTASAVEQEERSKWKPRTHLRHVKGNAFLIAIVMATLGGIFCLGFLLYEIFSQGWQHLSWDFLTSFPSRFAHRAGIKSALWGSAYLIVFTAIFAIPLGIGAAIYLEEFAKPSKLRSFIDINIANLAGVPSIVYGMLGLVIFVRFLALGRSVVAGALTMSLLILPIIIVASREALKAVPLTIRHAAFGLGATKWQTVRAHVLPAATPGILTGVILSMSRALGETAPLIMMGALTYVAFIPEGPMDSFTVLPIQIFNWTSRPQIAFHDIASAAIIVLLGVLLITNGIAVVIRQKFQNKARW